MCVCIVCMVCMYVCVVCAHMCVWGPEEGIRTPGANVPSGCELPNVDAEPLLLHHYEVKELELKIRFVSPT